MTTTPTPNICRCPCCNETARSRVIRDGICSVCGHVPGEAIPAPAPPATASPENATGERLTRAQRRAMDRYVRKAIHDKTKGEAT